MISSLISFFFFLFVLVKIYASWTEDGSQTTPADLHTGEEVIKIARVNNYAIQYFCGII